jgi:hypothetical protein
MRVAPFRSPSGRVRRDTNSDALRAGQRHRVPPEAWSLLAIAAAVLVANAPYLLGFSDPNPLGPRSGLVSAVTPGRLPGEGTIDPNNGFVSQALGHRAAIDWLHLRPPWWNPYEGSGAPLAGELQSAALFPPTLLTLLTNGQLFERMLLELVAGLSTYLLLRRISLSRSASVAAAIAYALNGTFAWLSHAPVNPVPLLPLLLLAVELAYGATVARRRGGWWLIAVAGATSFYAGFPEVAYIDTLLGVCWFAWRCGCLGRERLGAFAAKGAAGATAAALLSAPLLVASIDYVRHADLGGHASGEFGTLHLPTQALPQLVLPYIYGPIFAFSDRRLVVFDIWGSVGGYLSASLLLFALVGLVARARRGLRLTLLAWIVLVLSRIYGEPPLLGRVLGLLPGMSHLAFYRYAFPSVELAVVVLAALGVDELAKASSSRRRFVAAALTSLVVVALAALAARPLAQRLGSGLHQSSYLAGSAAWAAAIVLAGGAATLLRGSRARTWLAAALLTGEALVLFAMPEASAPRRVHTDLAPVAFLQRQLGSSRFVTLGPLQPNYGSYYGIGALNINDIPIPEAFAHFVRMRLDQAVDPTAFIGNSTGGRSRSAPTPRQELLRNLAGYRAISVAYVLTPAGRALPESPTTFRLVFRSPSAWIYRLAGSAPYFTASNPACAVSSQSRTSVQLSCPKPTVLVRRETYLPGWSAKVDGRAARVSKVDDLFQAVTVGRGSHRVTFGYSPPHIGWGFSAFVAGCGWLLLAASSRRLGVAGPPPE